MLYRGPWTQRGCTAVNKAIRRRSNVVGISPHRSAIVRLLGAVLAEQNDEWAIARRYMSLESLRSAPTAALPPADEPTNPEEVLLAKTA